MLELLSKNSEWLFSGLGVVVLTFVARGAWQRFGPKSTPAQHPAQPSVTVRLAPANVEESAYRTSTLDRALITKRVKVGDFIDLVRDKHHKIRIRVIAIEAVASSRILAAAGEKVAAVSLHIDLGGAIAHGGINVKEDGVNRFTLPQFSSHENDDSVFSFHNVETYSSLFRVYVEHINEKADEVDLNILHIVGVVRAA